MAKILLILIALLYATPAFAIVRNVRIPEKGNQNDYVIELTREHPLPKDINYELHDKILWIVGNGYISADWTGYTKAETDYQTEKTAEAVALGVVVGVSGLGYLGYKKLQA